MGIFSQMRAFKKIHPLYLSGSLVYAVALIFFYLKYVPLIAKFQIALIPILLAVCVLTATHLKRGLLLFIFFFPLINNLPYLFGIFETTPHAPMALILFLFFFLGFLIHNSIHKPILIYRHPVFNPMLLFASLVLISMLITSLRYANFFPFLSDNIYELITNTHGVTAGGAIMSVLFNSLNYLTSFGFFFILVNVIRSMELLKKSAILLCASTFLSLLFGLIQLFVNSTWGNNPISIKQGLINATFKDALSFGVFLAVTTPFFLGFSFSLKKKSQFFYLGVAVLSGFLIFFIGSKSGLLSLLIGMFVFVAFSIFVSSKSPKSEPFYTNWKILIASIFAVMLGITVISLLIINGSTSKKLNQVKTFQRIQSTFSKENTGLLLKGRSESLWKMAIDMLKDYPLTGVGAGGYIIEYSNYSQLHQTQIWEKVERTIDFKKGVELIRPYCILYDTTGTVWFDDVYIKTEKNESVIPNPSMEEGNIHPDYWRTDNNNLSIEEGWDKDVAHSGSRSLKIENTTGTEAHWLGESLRFPRPYPQTLTLGGWAKVEEIGDGGIFALDFYIEFDDGSHLWLYDNLRFSSGIHRSSSESAENYFLQVGSEMGILGLFLIFWVFIEIFKQMKQSFKRIPNENNDKFILIGVIAGIIAFLLNIQFHTYIGSYEIQYTFWFLVGLVFCMNRTENRQKEHIQFRKYLKYTGFLVLIVFSSIHLWNSTHSLSLKTRTERLELQQDFGFYQKEKTDEGIEFRWTREYGGMTIMVENPIIEIPILASHPDIHEKPVTVKVYLTQDFFKTKIQLDEIIIKEEKWEIYKYELPNDVKGRAILLLKVNRTWNPQNIKGTPDPRNLGVAVGSVEFKDEI